MKFVFIITNLILILQFNPFGAIIISNLQYNWENSIVWLFTDTKK